MRKFGLLLLGGIAGIIFLANLGPMIALVVTGALLYFIVKGFLKTESTTKKIILALIGCIVLASTVSNVPAIFGLLAAYVLYMVYRKWNNNSKSCEEKNDPFTNFEKQWAELKQI